MSATVQRLRAPSGNRDNDYHRPVCPSCNWKGPLYSNRTVEGLRLAERAAAQHQCDGTPTCAAHATQLDSEDVQ